MIPFLSIKVKQCRGVGLCVDLLLCESHVELLAILVTTHSLCSKQLYAAQQKLIHLTLNVLLAGNGSEVKPDSVFNLPSSQTKLLKSRNGFYVHAIGNSPFTFFL